VDEDIQTSTYAVPYIFQAMFQAFPCNSGGVLQSRAERYKRHKVGSGWQPVAAAADDTMIYIYVIILVPGRDAAVAARGDDCAAMNT